MNPPAHQPQPGFDFGHLLRTLRRRAGMTQADLAAAVAYSVAPFLIDAFSGYDESRPAPTAGVTVLVALGVLAVASVLNYLGTRALSVAAMVGLIAEMIGSVAIGVYLIIRNFVFLAGDDPAHPGHTFDVFFTNIVTAADGTMTAIGEDGPFGSGIGGYFGAFAWAASDALLSVKQQFVSD